MIAEYCPFRAFIGKDCEVELEDGRVFEGKLEADIIYHIDDIDEDGIAIRTTIPEKDIIRVKSKERNNG